MLSLFLLALLSTTVAVAVLPPPPPTLSGSHLRFTVVQDEGFVNIQELEEASDSIDVAKRYNITGYSIDIIREVAARANFTYELLPPSGFGSLCTHTQMVGQNDEADTVNMSSIEPYGKEYWSQYMCGQSDVQEDYTKHNNSQYNTDLYQSMFYVTPERSLLNRFTIPFVPPVVGNLQLFGTATHVRNVEDYVRQQTEGKVGKICLNENTALSLFVIKSFPEMQYELVYDGFGPESIHAALESGKCDAFFGDYPKSTQTIMAMNERRLCRARGMPIGLVGSPLEFGFSQFAMGIRSSLERRVDDILNYWMNFLMTCSPGVGEGQCPWNFASGYSSVGGEDGTECGYVAFPENQGVPLGVVVGTAVGASLWVLMLAVGAYWYVDRVRRHRRIRKRFVQQLARYIEIGNSPNDIKATKLAEMFQYIAGNESIRFTKEEFLKWMMDIYLPFLSDRDLKLLWSSLNKNQLVSPVEFILFLQTCEREFAIVRQELDGMPKQELIKFKVRRLTSIAFEGEEVVRRREHELNKMHRGNDSDSLRNNDSKSQLSSVVSNPFDESLRRSDTTISPRMSSTERTADSMERSQNS